MATHPHLGRRRGFRPTTRLGWWAVCLASAYFPLSMAWSILPGGALAAFACGAAGGIVGVVAIRRDGERAISVLLAVVPLVFVLVFVVAEVLVPH